jgi:phage shock protein A
MKDLQVLVAGIEEKVKQVLQLRETLEEENGKLRSRISEAEKTNEAYTATIKQLEEENKILRLSKSLTTDKGKTVELKQMLSELIREIDKCIGLLIK